MLKKTVTRNDKFNREPNTKLKNIKKQNIIVVDTCTYPVYVVVGGIVEFELKTNIVRLVLVTIAFIITSDQRDSFNKIVYVKNNSF